MAACTSDKLIVDNISIIRRPRLTQGGARKGKRGTALLLLLPTTTTTTTNTTTTTIVQTMVQKLVENYCFSRVSEGTLGTFWARFWRCSILQGHCVSLSGRVRFQFREGRAAAATGAAGGFYVSLYNQWYKNWSKLLFF